jgi:hypothetical protein
MALLTAQPLFKIYQSDAVNNIQESPGASSVIPADGSTNTATPGKTPGIKTMQSGSQPSGSNVGTRTLSNATIQQANNTRAGTTGASTGFQVSAIGSSAANDKTGDNSLQNDTSAMAPVASVFQHSVPTPATGAGLSDGLSQSPETLG